VTHLGQRLSALIDGELEGSERERVLLHMTRCDSCREEVAALRTLKRRMSALGDAAAGAGLTGRLMGLSALVKMADSDPADDARSAAPSWPDQPGGARGRGQGSDNPPPSWPDRPDGMRGRGQGSDNAPPSWPDRPDGMRGRGQGSAEQRTGRYLLAASLAVFLAGLGTAAFIAGGEPQPQAPTPPVTPSVDVMVFPHRPFGDVGTTPPVATPSSLHQRVAFSAPHPSHTRT
jgi:anti-sigma factor RsiW